MSKRLRTNIVLAGTTNILERKVLESLQNCSKELELHLIILKRSSSVTPHVYGYAGESFETAYVNYENPETLAATLVTLKPTIVISALNAEPESELDNLLLTAAVTASEKLGCHIDFLDGCALDILHPLREKYASYLASKTAFARRLAIEAERRKISYTTLVSAGCTDHLLMRGFGG